MESYFSHKNNYFQNKNRFKHSNSSNGQSEYSQYNILKCSMFMKNNCKMKYYYELEWNIAFKLLNKNKY